MNYTKQYLSLDRIYAVNDSLYNGIKLINKNLIKRELAPVLSMQDTFDLELATKCSINFIKSILKINKDEFQYLLCLKHSKYNIKLLFQGASFDHLLNHPMIKWHLVNQKNEKNN